MGKLKKFNGQIQSVFVAGRKNNSHRSRFHMYIAVYSQKQAAKIISAVSGMSISPREIRNYWPQCWGYAAERNIPEPTTPCAWIWDNQDQEWVDVTPQDL